MKKLRPIIGVFMIVLAIGSICYWESYGRENFMMREVLSARTDIKKGDTISEEMLKTSRVHPENLIKGYFSNMAGAVGKVANFDIPKNCQLANNMIGKKEDFVGGEKSIFVIPEEWIYMRSSSLRREDRIDIYSISQKDKIGTFKLAFVKDNMDREVTDIAGNKDDILKRGEATGMINHLEIICDRATYEKMISISNISGKDLIIMQGGYV